MTTDIKYTVDYTSWRTRDINLDKYKPMIGDVVNFKGFLGRSSRTRKDVLFKVTKIVRTKSPIIDYIARRSDGTDWNVYKLGYTHNYHVHFARLKKDGTLGKKSLVYKADNRLNSTYPIDLGMKPLSLFRIYDTDSGFGYYLCNKDVAWVNYSF